MSLFTGSPVSACKQVLNSGNELRIIIMRINMPILFQLVPMGSLYVNLLVENFFFVVI